MALGSNTDRAKNKSFPLLPKEHLGVLPIRALVETTLDMENMARH